MKKSSVIKKIVIASIIFILLTIAGVLVWRYIKTPVSFNGSAYTINGIDVKEDDISILVHEYREKNNLLEHEAWEQFKTENEIDSMDIRNRIIKDLTDMYSTEVIAQKYNIEISNQEVDYHLNNKTSMYDLAMKNKKLVSLYAVDKYSDWEYVKNELLKARIDTEYVYTYECSDDEINEYLNICDDSLHNAQSYSVIAVSQEVAPELRYASENIKNGNISFDDAAFNMYILHWTYSYAFPKVVFYNNTYALPKSVVMALPTNLQVGQVSDVIFNNGYYFIAKYEGPVDAPEIINSKDDLSEQVLEQIKQQIKAENAYDIINSSEVVAKEMMGFIVYYPNGELPY